MSCSVPDCPSTGLFVDARHKYVKTCTSSWFGHGIMQNIRQQSEHSKSYSLNLCQSKKYISPQTCTLYQLTNLHTLSAHKPAHFISPQTCILYQPTNLYTVNSFIYPRWSNGSIAVHSVHNKFKIYIHRRNEELWTSFVMFSVSSDTV